MMTASAEVPPGGEQSPKKSNLPVCTVCSNTMVAAEASALVSEDEVTHLWTCDTCGFGLVTRHSIR